MRLALLGAFPFPFPQGSQVYVADQARGLRRAGAEPVLVTYGSGSGSGTGASPGCGLEHVRCPRWLSPPRGRSGPSLRKPVADAALAATYVAAHRQRGFDVAFAHNAEAAVVAIATRRVTRVPVVYVAHTLLRHELSSYLPARVGLQADILGAAIDRWIAARADAIVALSEDARRMLYPWAHCEIEVIPPGADPAPPPPEAEQLAVCRRLGLAPGRFALYAGNVDAYQELELLEAAAARCSASDLDFVVATHDARQAAARLPHLRLAELPDYAGVRALTFAAEMLVLTRRRPGGFPIKLLNYMESGRPIVAYRRIAPTLVDGESALLLPEGAGASELARALESLRAEPARARALGLGAQAVLAREHDGRALARRTLALAQRVVRRRAT